MEYWESYWLLYYYLLLTIIINIISGGGYTTMHTSALLLFYDDGPLPTYPPILLLLFLGWLYNGLLWNTINLFRLHIFKFTTDYDCRSGHFVHRSTYNAYPLITIIIRTTNYVSDDDEMPKNFNCIHINPSSSPAYNNPRPQSVVGYRLFCVRLL